MDKAQKDLNILYLAFLFGQLMVLGIFYYLRGNSPVVDNENNMIFKLIATIAAVAVIIFSRRINPLASINDPSLSEEEKVEKFRSSNIIRWAIVEGVVLIAAVFYFLESDSYFLLVGMVMTLFFYTLKVPPVNAQT